MEESVRNFRTFSVVLNTVYNTEMTTKASCIYFFISIMQYTVPGLNAFSLVWLVWILMAQSKLIKSCQASQFM